MSISDWSSDVCSSDLHHRYFRLREKHFVRCMNFLAEYDDGRIYINDKLLGYKLVGEKLVRDSETGIDKLRQSIGMVFQHFNLWPHMTVLGNVTEALKRVKKLDKMRAAEIEIGRAHV